MSIRFLICFFALIVAAPSLLAWSEVGHRMIARLAIASLPTTMPEFFTDASETLMFLNPEPDSWRDAAEEKLSPALRRGHDPDHFFKFELYAPATLPLDRYSFFEELHKQGKDLRQVGMLPYRAIELFQRLRIGFRRWRSAQDPKIARLLEARIVDDAGILGHYIADTAMPLHMSVSSNGWALSDNPKGYTRDNTLHRRFETEFVRARISDADVKPVLSDLRVTDDALSYIYAEMRRSYDQMIPLYELEKAAPFGPENSSPEAKRFVSSRLADAVSTLRDLWFTAWQTSAQ